MPTPPQPRCAAPTLGASLYRRGQHIGWSALTFGLGLADPAWATGQTSALNAPEPVNVGMLLSLVALGVGLALGTAAVCAWAWRAGQRSALASSHTNQQAEGNQPPSAVHTGSASMDLSHSTACAELDTETQALIYALAHDLRAPLRVSEGFARILREDYSERLDRIAVDHLDRVLGASARMQAMIDAVLALSRMSSQPLHWQPIELSQLAHYVVEDLQKADPGRHVDVRIESGLSDQGDPTLLRTVLENLLGNAWKYTAQTQSASIGLRREIQHGRQVYTVHDNGAGFDMRFAERLFGLFQRLHSPSEFPGHGVGLASVRRILRRHGGDIWVEAAPGAGARFYFTIGSKVPSAPKT